MKKGIKHFLYRGVSIVLFITIFLCLFLQTNELLRRKFHGRLDMIHSFYEIKKNTLDVAFVGSSHCYYGINPNVLWKEKGYTSYVMASSAQTPMLSYFLLKDILERQNPKVVVYETYGLTYKDAFPDEFALRNVVDNMEYTKNKIGLLNVACKDMTLEEKVSFYIPLVKYHDRWSNLQPHDYVQDRTFLKGCVTTLETRRYEDCQEHYIEPKIPYETGWEYFEKIIELCKEKNVQLVLAAAPMNDFKYPRYKKYYAINLYVEKFAQENNIPFIFYEKMDVPKEYQIDPYSDYIDSGHMNYFGMEKFTRLLGDYIEDHYDISSHTDDPAYANWQDEYLSFEKYLNKLEEDAKDGSNIVKIKSNQQFDEDLEEKCD